MECLLNPAAALVQSVTSQADDMERIHHRDSSREFFHCGGLKTREPVHRDNLNMVTPGLGSLGEPGLERLFGTTFDHVKQLGRASAVTDRGEVDDHRHVLVTSAGVSPYVLVNADHTHTIKPGGIGDQHSAGFSQDRIISGVPRHAETLCDACDGQMLTHDGFQRPAKPTPRQFRSRQSGLVGVLSPHTPTPITSVPDDRDQQRRGAPPERLMRQSSGHTVTGAAFTPAPMTPPVRVDNPASKNRSIRLDKLPGHFKAKAIKPAKRGQIRTTEGNVKQG